jgi:hypothetical protein
MRNSIQGFLFDFILIADLDIGLFINQRAKNVRAFLVPANASVFSVLFCKGLFGSGKILQPSNFKS